MKYSVIMCTEIEKIRKAVHEILVQEICILLGYFMKILRV